MAKYLMSLIACYGSALAGASNSGGGGLVLKDTFNPWFLQNTPTVHYCIDRDGQVFHVSDADSDAMIQVAWKAWQTELSKDPAAHNRELQPPNDQIMVATQSLQRDSACSDATDLRFQLGTLSREQLAKVEDIDTTIAVTVRTSYDRKMLRGKGFIYLAPDEGPAGRKSQHGQVWASGTGGVLYLTLVHELGHVFGLPDAGIDDEIMSHNVVETVFYEPEIFGSAFDPSNSTWNLCLVDCVPRDVDGGFMIIERGDKQGLRSLYLGIPNDGSNFISTFYSDHKISIYAGKSKNSMQLVGMATVIETRDRWSDLITVWLPREQQVYQLAPLNAIQLPNTLTVKSSYKRNVVGTYNVLATGQHTSIFIDFFPIASQATRVAAVAGTQLFPDLLNPDDYEFGAATGRSLGVKHLGPNLLRSLKSK